MNNGIKKILKFEELEVKELKNLKWENVIRVEMPVKEHICPCCGKITKKIHDYLPERKIKDLPFGKIKTTLLYRPRRYTCPCGKKFLEKCEEIMPSYKMTKRFIGLIIEKTREVRSFKDIAKEIGVSSTTVTRIFDFVKYRNDQIGEYLCIDEFKGNLEKFKYQAVMVNPKTSKVIYIHRNRYKLELSHWFSKIKKETRYNVKYFICDMWDSYIELAQHYFPRANIIVDRFHYTRYMTEAMNTVRKEIQNTLGKELRVYMKHSRAILLGRKEKILKSKKYDAEKELMKMLNLSPKLTTAYQLLQEFYSFNDSQSRDEAKEKLKKIYEDVEKSGLKEFEDAAKTIQNYEKYILNSFMTKYTNSYAEGVNTLIKTFKRIGFGYKNLKRFENRIKHYQAA